MVLFLLSLTPLHNTVCRCSEGPLLCLWCSLILINFIQFLLLMHNLSILPFPFFVSLFSLFLFSFLCFLIFFFWNLPSLLFETLFIISTNQWVLPCGILFRWQLICLQTRKCCIWVCYLKLLSILKESTFLQNFVFTLVVVNVMAASNSDANLKKVRQRQGFALQESVPGVEL